MSTLANLASAIECRTLHRLSGWDGQYWWWQERIHGDGSESYELIGEHEAPFDRATFPAYDAGYLAAMLPGFSLRKYGNGNFIAEWRDYSNDRYLEVSSRTNPANALCRLAIALFEAGVLLHDSA